MTGSELLTHNIMYLLNTWQKEERKRKNLIYGMI